MEIFASSRVYAATEKASNVSLVKKSALANKITLTMRMKSMLDYTLTDRKTIPPMWETPGKPSMQPVKQLDQKIPCQCLLQHRQYDEQPSIYAHRETMALNPILPHLAQTKYQGMGSTR